MTPRPRLWFVNRFFHPDRSATSQLLSDLAFHLADGGRSVAVLTSRGRYDDPDDTLPEVERVRGVAIHRVAQPRFGRASLLGRGVDYVGMYSAFARALARLASPGDIVVAKTDPPLLLTALAPVARAKRLRLVNWLQDLYPEVAIGLGLRALAPAAPMLRAARDAALRSAHRNVAIGDAMRDRLVARGLDVARVAVIENWCDDEAIRPIPRAQNPLAEQWGVGARFTLGYSGNLGRAHDYMTLVSAAEALRDEDVVFLVVGGGHHAAALRAEIERRGLGARFQFRPYQPAEELPRSLTLPDAHWLSLAPAMEGLIVPSKIYGVAAAGRPMIVVAEPTGEVASLVVAHACGFAVAPGDSAGFAGAVRAMMRDAGHTAAMGANARKMLDARFSRRRALARWTALLDETAAEPPRGRG